MSQPRSALDVREIHQTTAPEVLRGVDLRVEPAECPGYSGRNGAGRSTLIHVLCGLRRPTPEPPASATTVRVRRRHARLIGYAPQELSALPPAGVAQNLAAFGELHGLGRRECLTRGRGRPGMS